MPRAQCYYEILGIEETASADEVKRAYKNQALIWHPDKNQTNPDEAHKKFQTILKAYETLSDSREREWYDRHKDQILSGDCDKDTSAEVYLNLFQYFSSSCYANFDDSEDGFYTVYRQVFETLSKEEEQAFELLIKLSNSKTKSTRKEQKPIHPTFGNSDSTYEEIVRPFYSYWSGFCTVITFDHLDKYNTTEAENRRILRAMEKENNKVKEAARKERNTNVRNLVEFVKKRDRRLKAHKLLVEQQNQLNREKTAEKQRQQREKLKQQEQDAVYKPTAWEDMNDIEAQLRQLESEYDLQEAGGKRGRSNQDSSLGENSQNHEDGIEGGEDAQEEEMEDEDDGFFCPACNKDFRSIKAFENHEASKKHKQNVVKLKKLLKEDEQKLVR